MAGTSSTTNDSNKIRRGLYECVCGKVKADVIIQPKGWTRAEPFTLYCGCRDCVNYTNTVSNYAAVNEKRPQIVILNKPPISRFFFFFCFVLCFFF